MWDARAPAAAATVELARAFRTRGANVGSAASKPAAAAAAAPAASRGAAGASRFETVGPRSGWMWESDWKGRTP